MYSQKTIPLSQALLRSQNVPCSGRALTVAPTSPETTVQGALYRALLHLRALDNIYTRRFTLPLPPTSRFSR